MTRPRGCGTPDGAELFALKGHAELSKRAFSPDGARLLTGSDDNTARLWDARTGAELLALKGHADAHERGLQPRRRAPPHRLL